jgi:HEPN domain-containing protein
LKLNYNDYREASASKIATARQLHRMGRYSAAIYFSGVSIECLLRAFIVRKNPEFDSRHDLSDLYKKSQLQDIIHPKNHREAGAWLGDIWTRWKNNYRYVSDDRLKVQFRRLRLNRGIKGDFLKENSNIAVNSALNLWTLGERRWASKTR